MHVVATAGHVDHGKSTLVRALTGTDPDRWAEEQRRGMTIDLGYAWTPLPSGEVVSFVDVPGHQRFIGNMLAGLGPAPAVMLVVAADEGWRRQSAEHLAAIDALGVQHGVLAVTRSDLADPGPASAEALHHLARSSLGSVPCVFVSGTTGAGLPDLRAALDAVVSGLPAPDLAAPVRLWVDRAFTIRGAGTVVTGTLSGGQIAVGDELELHGRRVVVRGLQSLEEPVDRVGAVARVAVNLRGVDRDEVGRGDALLTPGSCGLSDAVAVRVTAERLPRELVVHVGSAAVPGRVHRTGGSTARVRLARALPLQAGDRLILRDPAAQQVLAGGTVLELGAARRRRSAVSPSSARLVELVTAHARRKPLEPGLPVAEARVALGLGVRADLQGLVERAGLELVDGRVRSPGYVPDLGPAEEVVRLVEKRLAESPFDAPSVKEPGLSAQQLAAAVTARRLLRLGDVVVLPEAPARAVTVLAEVPSPFGLAEARQALGARRAVVVALLEHLDALGLTVRLTDGTRVLANRAPSLD